MLKNTSEFSAYVVSTFARSVSIASLPESDNADSNGLLTVVIFGAAGFDAAQIDVSSVHFTGAAAWQSKLVDVNSDGVMDMQLKFRRQDTKCARSLLNSC
jgi:hypothetical protein